MIIKVGVNFCGPANRRSKHKITYSVNQIILASKRDLVQVEAYIDSKYSSRDMFWCRLILLTRTPFRDKCLDLLYKSILVSSVDYRSQFKGRSFKDASEVGFLCRCKFLLLGNKDGSKPYPSIDVHS